MTIFSFHFVTRKSESSDEDKCKRVLLSNRSFKRGISYEINIKSRIINSNNARTNVLMDREIQHEAREHVDM